MISETVWNDAFARAQSVCRAVDLDLVDPLAQDLTSREDAYWLMPVGAASSDRLGAGENQNEETGQVILILRIPVGAMTTPNALTHIQAMSDAFRVSGQGADRWPLGLYYDGQDFTPPDLSATGNWYDLTLMISYRDQTTMQTV